MAIKIYEQFAPFANPADGDYPLGSFKNDSIPGAEDGTPLDAVWANDYAGFDAELFAQAGVVPNGQPDKLGASQRVDAVKKVSSLQAAILLIEQWGYTYKGTFAKGFTYSQVGDVGVDADFNAWIYVGAGAPNKVVSAGTVPSEPLYQVIHVSDHNKTTNRNAAGAHDAIYNRQFATLSDAVIAVGLEAGVSIEVKERTLGNGGGAVWDVALAESVNTNTYNVVQCTGTIGLALVLRVNEHTDVTHFGAVSGGLDCVGAIHAARDFLISKGMKRIIFPSGVFLIDSPILLDDTRIGIVGAGVDATIIRLSSSAGGVSAIQQINTSGGDNTSEHHSDFTLQGSYVVNSIGINQGYVRRGLNSNIKISGFYEGLRQINSFVCTNFKVLSIDCRNCFNFDGANHVTSLIGCGAVDFGDSFGGVGFGVLIQNNGDDGLQSSICLRDCDIEFGSGIAISNGSSGTTILDNCYTEMVSNVIFQCLDGTLIIRGGEHLIDNDNGGYLAEAVGGNAHIVFDDRAGITSSGVSRIYDALIKEGLGKVIFESSDLYQRYLTTNSGVLPFPSLGVSANIRNILIDPQGRYFGANAFSGGLSQTDLGDTKRVECTSAGAIGVYQKFSRRDYQIGHNNVLLVQYRSNTTISATFVNSAGQDSPYLIGTLPNTGGETKIAVFTEARVTDNQKDWLEFWKAGVWGVGEYLEIDNVTILPSSVIRQGALTLT